MTPIFFNLLVNAACSLLGGYLVVAFFIWLFRVETGPWKLFLLSLPFVKIVYDIARGVPQSSILHTNLDTFNLPPRHHQLSVGGHLNQWGPGIRFEFAAKAHDGTYYGESLGDYLHAWVNKRFGPEVPVIILSAVLAVSATLLGIRLVQAFRFEKERREDRRSAKPFRSIPLRFREVDVYVSSHFAGTPFTGGILRPYICLPMSAVEKLEPEELEAVIAHELGHVRQFDLLATIAVQVIGDLFWFIPGYRRLSRKIDRLREIVADHWAVRSGIEPPLLASALLKLKEIPAPDRFVLYSAFFREKSLLKERVHRLLEANEKKPRFGWQFKWVRVVVGFWIFCAVMTTTIGGNHRNQNMKSTTWVEKAIERWGVKVQ